MRIYYVGTMGLENFDVLKHDEGPCITMWINKMGEHLWKLNPML